MQQTKPVNAIYEIQTALGSFLATARIGPTSYAATQASRMTDGHYPALAPTSFENIPHITVHIQRKIEVQL